MLTSLLCTFIILVFCSANIHKIISCVVVVPINHLGLANRLRILSSSYSIASAKNCDMLVLWHKNEECPCEFSDLFNHISSIVFPTSDSSLFTPSSIGLFLYSRLNISNDSLHLVSHLHNQKFRVDTTFIGSSVYILWSLGVHVSHAHSCQQFLQSRHNFYQFLTPTPSVKAIVDRVKKELLVVHGAHFPSLIGVHIRAFDRDQDWAVVTPNADMDISTSRPISSTLHALRFDESASMESFVSLMDDILAVNGSIRFFVASNSPDAKSILRMRYGDRVVTLDDNNDLGRGSLDSMTVAAAEFLLLAECAVILHTRGSSFAREAGNVYGRHVVDVTSQSVVRADGAVKSFVHFYSQHSTLPHCAMPEFIRSDQSDQSPGAGWPRVCYHEGEGPDSRVMCTVKYKVCRCDRIFTGDEEKRDFRDDLTRTCAVGEDCNVAGNDGNETQSVEDIVRSLVYCPVPFSDTSNNELVDEDCVFILAESNGYSL